MENKKQIKNHYRYIITTMVMLFFSFCFSFGKGEAAEYLANLVTNRAMGQCSYTLTGLTLEQKDTITLQVVQADTGNIALNQEIVPSEEDYQNSTYQGEFRLEDLSGTCADYLVNFIIGEETIFAGNCDFSIHAENTKMKIKGRRSDSERTVKLNFSESEDGVLVPNPNNNSGIVILAWKEEEGESSAETIGEIKTVSGGSITCPVDITSAGDDYGTWLAKAVLRNSEWEQDITLAETKYEVLPTLTGLIVKKSKALEKKKAFRIQLTGLKNAYEVKKVIFRVYDDKEQEVLSLTGQKRNEKKGSYDAEVSMKKLDYALDMYTIRAFLVDINGTEQELPAEAPVDARVQNGTLTIEKKGNAACSYRLQKAYIPGNIKKVEFILYQVESDGEKKLETYTAKAKIAKQKFAVSVKHEQIGNYKVKAYGYTAWDKKILLNEQEYQMKKKDMGKNGWYYETYQGQKYKFYYKNNVKQTDLTDILNIQESNASTGSNLYIEVNRAACNVTIYLYNEETKQYDIPVKTCAVSVGRDTYSTAGASSLNVNSSFTPLGDFSICTNGTAAKFTLKPMYEPDGSTVYARWCTHIVGNVYFHAIAVGSQSHYSLSSYTYSRLGSPASAGCIRMTVADAKWIYDYAKTGTKVVIVKGDSSKPGPLGKGKTIKTSSVSYDPTDPEVPDSRKKSDYKAGRISGYMTGDGERVGY